MARCKRAMHHCFTVSIRVEQRVVIYRLLVCNWDFAHSLETSGCRGTNITYLLTSPGKDADVQSEFVSTESYEHVITCKSKRILVKVQTALLSRKTVRQLRTRAQNVVCLVPCYNPQSNVNDLCNYRARTHGFGVLPNEIKNEPSYELHSAKRPGF